MEARLKALGLPVTPETIEWAQRVQLTEGKVPAVLEAVGMTKAEARDVAEARPRISQRKRLDRLFG